MPCRQDAERERDEAKDDVEQEAKRRRLAQEHASSLRRLLIVPDGLPPVRSLCAQSIRNSTP